MRSIQRKDRQRDWQRLAPFVEEKDFEVSGCKAPSSSYSVAAAAAAVADNTAAVGNIAAADNTVAVVAADSTAAAVVPLQPSEHLVGALRHWTLQRGLWSRRDWECLPHHSTRLARFVAAWPYLHKDCRARACRTHQPIRPN